ncbi:hypothetical protein [Crateriforma conspicua]|uniref:Uncharacterized protein n=1 Tax=Crateriforma conspicua TaxID=2527996 RepID=A0A5C5Y7U8_9PLAN|nr:hypothetical protein [Crateriforma conspicua]TWT71254.1 hypothetical protein Pan14r_35640 [Crateriforma conspicua]
MRPLSRRWAVGLIVFSSLIFTAALVLFCLALGLDLRNEGWSGPKSDLLQSGRSIAMVVASAVMLAVAIVMFFVGLHRISKPDDLR